MIVADLHSLTDLKAATIRFIVKHMDAVIQTEGWQLLKEQQQYRHLGFEIIEIIAEKDDDDDSLNSTFDDDDDHDQDLRPDELTLSPNYLRITAESEEEPWE